MSIGREIYNNTCSDVRLMSVQNEIQNCVLVTVIKGYSDVGERRGEGLLMSVRREIELCIFDVRRKKNYASLMS